MKGLPEWGGSFLEGRRHATLGTIEPDGTPHLAPVWYLFRDGRLFVGTNSATRKFKNAAARPTASIVVDLRIPGIERWVSASGPVTVLRGEEARAVVASIQARYLTAEALADPSIGPGFAAGDDVALCIHPAKWRAWAASDLDAQFFGGALGANPRKWFRELDGT
jgi:PPOX class probable F420-dependent enzyme